VLVNKKNSVEQASRQLFPDFGSAISFLRSLKPSKFVQSIDMAVNFSNKNKSGSVKGFVAVENPIVRELEIIVFADEKIDGIKRCGGRELIEELVKNKRFKCDLCFCHPKYLPLIMSSGLARILGMRKLMPDSKLGTVGENVKEIVESFKKGVVIFRSDKFNTLHCTIGKASLGDKELEQNFGSVIGAISSVVPQGMSISSVYLSTTMSKGSAEIKWNKGGKVG